MIKLFKLPFQLTIGRFRRTSDVLPIVGYTAHNVAFQAQMKFAHTHQVYEL